MRNHQPDRARAHPYTMASNIYTTGWALVVPDGDEPVFRIFSEAESPEEADALVEYYANMISSQIDEE